ncbi:MAG: acetyltransferase [Armatimonadetes bacterium]|nr:acetyltransferase [Armatimonadota bacterium]
MKKLVIWGCGGHGREINWLCEQLGIKVIGFLDERPEMKEKIIDDVPVLGDINDIINLKEEIEIVCAGVGDPVLKKYFVNKIIKAGFKLSGPLVHPNINISKRNTLEIGCIICEGSILTINIHIGNFVIINRNTNISHDVIIEDFATVAPGVNISGNVTIKEGAYIGTGASIREKIKIGAWSIVGGGAFVKEDIPDKTLYAGVPAKFKKSLS